MSARLAMVSMLVALWVASAGAASGQDATADEAVALDPIQVTAGRREEAAARVPQPVAVIEAQRIRESALQTWAEALRGVPGVFFQSSGPGQGMAIVRGLKGSEVLHLVDGMRLNNAIFRNAPNQYVALVDPLALARIELVRGPNSVVYGSDAMGGVIHLLTPERRFEGADWSAAGQAYTRWNSQDLSSVTRVDLAVGRRGLSLAAGGSWQDYGERRTAADGRLADTGYTARSADAKLLVDGEGGEWMLSHQDFTIPKLARYHQIVAGFGTQPDSEFAFFQPNARRFTHLRWRAPGAIGPMHGLAVHLARQLIVDDRYSRDFGTTVDTRERNRSELLGANLQAQVLVAGGELLWGIEYYDDTIDSARTEHDNDTGQTRDVRPRFPDGSTERSFGAFVRQEWPLADGGVVDAGLRWSAVRTRLPQTDRPGVLVDARDLSGGLGVLLPAGERLRLYANLGRGFRAPNVFDLGTLGPRPGNRFNAPNPDLEPEHLWSLDAGLKYLSARCAAELGLFAVRYEDRIASVPTGNPRADGRTEVQSRNVASARYRGLESVAACALGARWSLEASLNWTWGELREDGQRTPADRVPPLNGRLALRWRAGEHWQLRSEWLAAARQDRLAPGDVADSRIDPEGTAGWLRWDLAAAWRPMPSTELELAALNVLDASYREHGSGIDAPGRGVAIALRYRW